ncbi:MAG: hypothetical protein IIA72_04890 [Proteobacteria bacterium]|nr:hypothetical protein [Pseudomonadota bacterium]
MKDLFVSFIATGAIQLSNLASGILAARLLGPEGRGELAVRHIMAVVIAQWSSFALMAILARRNLGMSLLQLFRPTAADWRLAAASLKVWRT